MWYRIAKKNPDPRPLFIFDIDDTLVTTEAKILVKKGERTVVELTPAEFNTFDLENNPIILKDKELSGPGTYNFDFSQFMDSELFQETSKPIEPMINKVKALQKYVQKNPNAKIIFNTARSDFDAAEPVLNTFKDLGLNMDPAQEKYIHINRSGNYTDKIPTAEKKNKLLVEKYLPPGHDFTSVHFWDDAEENLYTYKKLNQFEHLKNLPLYAYLVKEGGKTQVWNDEAIKKYEAEVAKKEKQSAENLNLQSEPEEPNQA
jgi:hypothetical protein